MPATFPESLLSDTFLTLNGGSISFKQILEEHKAKTIAIGVWASWCKDYITGLPKVKGLQKNQSRNSSRILIFGQKFCQVENQCWKIPVGRESLLYEVGLEQRF